jgi:hypothetical protein
MKVHLSPAGFDLKEAQIPPTRQLERTVINVAAIDPVGLSKCPNNKKNTRVYDQARGSFVSRLP